MSIPPAALLDGITVLDFTRVLAGPYCTRMLGDLGARVIKIERPGEGDEVRHIVQQLMPGERTDQSSYFWRINTSKYGIGVDLAHPQAKPLVHDLVRKADVVVENFSPGVMMRYGFDADSLRALKPELVYCSISGFGQTGPLSSMQAYAHLINAISGLMDLDRGGQTEPRVSYMQTADVLSGAHAFGAICAALVRRGVSGRGATLDVSMLECMIAADDVSYTALLNGGEAHRGVRVGMLVHEIGGRHFAVQTAGAPQLWTKLLELMGKPELATDPRFSTVIARRQNWNALMAIYREWLDTFESVEQAIAQLTSARIPTVPMLSPEEIINHPQIAARRAFPSQPHPVAGEVRVTATPFFVDGAPTHPLRPAPYRVGEDTRQVLAEVLGYGEQQIDDLHKAKVIAIP